MEIVAHTTEALSVNANPLAFEELVTSLASLMAYAQDGIEESVSEFQRLYRQALRQPPNYKEITELTGEALSPADRRAGRTAWLLMNIESLKVYGVHSLVWHNKNGKYSAPILEQLSRVLGEEPKLSSAEYAGLGTNAIPLDVVGIKDKAIWLVQGVHEKKVVDSAVVRTRRSLRLFRGPVFQGVVLERDSLHALKSAYDAVRKAFPGTECYAYALAIHPTLPDFELYHVELPKKSDKEVVLDERRIKTNSVDHEDCLQQDHEALWTLAHRFDNDLFQGLPPCRGGRTLAILASTAKRQLESRPLLCWKEGEISALLRDDFDYVVPRDKVRHDLVDRLIGQGFMRKRGSKYFLTVKGIARYEYCLEKYTTKGTSDPMQVLEICQGHRDKIVERYGCV
jgi:hypothetical protein